MKKATACIFLPPVVLCPQTADVAYFRALLSTANETPPIDGYNAKGVGDVIVHMVKDSSGKIVSGSVDFLAHATFSGGRAGYRNAHSLRGRRRRRTGYDQLGADRGEQSRFQGDRRHAEVAGIIRRERHGSAGDH